MKTHSWLNRMQLLQRPSAAFSKPEQRIYISLVNNIENHNPCLRTFLRLQYLQAIAVR